MARILYFAGLVDMLGRVAEDVTLPAEVRDVRASALGDSAVRATVNKQFVNLDAPVAAADEIALVATRRP